MTEPLETVPGQLDELDRRVRAFEDRVDGRLQAGAERMNRMEGDLGENTRKTAQLVAAMAENTEKTEKLGEAVKENTELTRDIRDAIVFGRVGTKVIKWVGGIGAAVAGIVGAWITLKGGK